jgi:hypothetical protein
MKTCSKCKISKPATDFYKNKVMADGLHSFCIVCHKAANVARKAIKRADPEFKAKELAYKKEYRQRTVEQRKQYMQEWHAKNADAQIEYRKQYFLENSNYFKEYRQANKGAINARTRKRQAAKLQRTPAWLTESDHKVIWGFYEVAAMLTKHNAEPWEVDHKIPLQGKLVSGLHVPSNLQLMRSFDNRSKANKFEV